MTGASVRETMQNRAQRISRDGVSRKHRGFLIDGA